MIIGSFVSTDFGIIITYISRELQSTIQYDMDCVTATFNLQRGKH
jgi:hypothetical protein